MHELATNYALILAVSTLLLSVFAIYYGTRKKKSGTHEYFLQEDKRSEWR